MPTTKSGIVIPFPESGSSKIVVEAGGVSQEITIPWWVMSPDTEAKRQELLANQFFLLNQGHLGEIFRCSRCKGKHRRFTLMCIERPFDGLAQGLLAYYHHVGKNGLEKYLSTLEYQRYQEIHKVISRIGGNADLESSHPGLARTLSTGDDDYDVGAVSLGLLEPITRQKAEALAWNINARGIKPPFRLRGLERQDASVSV